VCKSLTPLKRFLESYFSYKEVLPIEIILARTQEDNKACGPIIIENIRDMVERKLSFMRLSDHDVLFLRDKQKTQLKSVDKELNLGENLSISQNFEGSDLDEYPISIGSSFITPLISNSVLESANCYNVESFLRMHAKRLGIYSGPDPQPISQLEIHDKDALITVYSKGARGSISVYKVYDPQVKVYDPQVPAYDSEGRQIFNSQLMNGQEFVPQDKASGGTRVVGFYSIEGERRLCFKHNPEAPGHEIAVRLLYKSLFPEDRKDLPLPASEVILMNDQIFLVSEFIKGENQEQILKKVDSNSNYGDQWNFNLKKIQKLVLFCLLTNPEDCRPQNCIIRMKGNNEYEFILIDNERSLVEEFVEYDDPQKGKVETRPHCFLFCFHELLTEPFDIETNDLILDHLKKYEEEQLYQYVLYEECRKKGVKQAKLCLWYSEKFMRDTSEKLKKIRLYTKNHKEEGCLANLFQEISPKLAEIYKIPKEVSPDSPGHRPKKVHKEDTERVPCKQAVTINFSNILERIREIDRGRIASTAPPSAYAYPSINFCSPFMPDLVYHLPEYTSSNLGDQDSLTTFDLMDNQSLTRRTFLNLSNNGMTDISVKAISRLINLTSLNLSSNLITNIGVKEISRLINLISLCLSDGTWRITDINALGQLINLTYLDLQNNSITSVSTLG